VKNVVIELDANIDELNKILENFGWRKFDPKNPKKAFDYYGISSGERKGEVVFHLADNCKKNLRTIKGFLSLKKFPEPTFTWHNIETSYEKARTVEQKLDVIAQILGLKRRITTEIFKFHIGKNSLTPLEREIIEEALDSFGIPNGFVVDDENLIVLFQKRLPKKFKKMLPELVNVWMTPGQKVEVNFDWDTTDKVYLYNKYLKKMLKEFKPEEIMIRESANKRFHGKIIKKLYTPEEAFKLRKKYGDSHYRLIKDKIWYKAGLKCNFLYDWKYGYPAGKWVRLDEWMKRWL
jgi:hypothetical protein